MSVIVIGSIVVTGIILFAAIRLVRHHRQRMAMHRFADQAMRPRLND